MKHILLIILVASTPLIAQQPSITVGPNVQVSLSARTRHHQEVLIAAHPTDVNQLMACSMIENDQRTLDRAYTGVYTSIDGGRSWKAGQVIPYSVGDPVCAYDPDGVAYFGALASKATVDPSSRGDTPWDYLLSKDSFYFALYRSTDRGQSWQARQPFWAGDRPWMTFDNTSTLARGRLYVAYQASVAPLDGSKQGKMSLDIAETRDGGATWGMPHANGVISENTWHSIACGISQLSDGTLVVLNKQNLRQSVFRASDDLRPAGSPPSNGPDCELRLTLMSPPDPRFRSDPKTVKVAEKFCSSGPATSVLDSLAVGTPNNPFKDRIYVAWADTRSGHTRIMFTFSSDHGSTWAASRVVDDMPAARAREAGNFMPTLAVNKDGVVGLTWYDRRDSLDDMGYGVRFSASIDGGETWLPSVRVSDQLNHFRKGEDTSIEGVVSPGNGTSPLTLKVVGGGLQIGDTAGLGADAAGVFHALWVDNRTGISQVFTSPITVASKAFKNGSVELAGLDDVTERLILKLSELTYEAANRTISADVVLWNRSMQPIAGRLVGRVVRLHSEVGDVSIVNADNGETGVGALFDFGGLLKAGQLAPKESSGTKRLRFRLDHVSFPTLKAGEQLQMIPYNRAYLNPEYLILELQILGEPIKKSSPN